ncbi:RidA family protein [Actinomadura napierensis]|uniref:RidA family protein n=1 Tax=Actinomadura napierensis TaxID=267854 RepID=A0ABN3A9W5_9ACTN
MLERETITPEAMTPPMGAYSHGYSVNVGDARMIFVTGQIAIDHEGNPVSDDIEVQTRFVFERVSSVLEAANSSMDDVVKAQIFLTDIRDFAVVSPIRNEFFGTSKPVSTLVEVSALVRPECKVEVEVIAISGANQA